MRSLMFILLLALTSAAVAQDQMMLRVNHSGVTELMRLALEYNQAGSGKAGFKIPRGIYSFKVARQDLAANPIIQILNQVSDVNFNRDFPFYVTNSDIGIVGSIVEPSLKTKVSNYTTTGFDLQVSFDVDAIKLSVADLSICETKQGSACGKGLRASFKNTTVALRKGSKISAVAKFRVNLASDKARVALVSVSSNLTKGPRLDINIGQVVVPPISIIINDQEAQLDTSGIRAEILQRREFLAQKLLAFASEFIAEDLAEMINKTLASQCFPTSLRLLEIGQEDRPATNGGFTTVPLVLGRKVHPHKNEPNMMELLQIDLAKIIKSATFDVKLKSIRSPLDRDLELRLNGALRMNRLAWQIRSTVGNSTRALPALNIDNMIDRRNHMAVVVSEPMVNGALDLLSSVGVFQKLVGSREGMDGVHIQSVKAHFKTGATPAQDRYYVIANIRVNLRDVAADGVWAWIKRFIAVWLERNNNDAQLYFPIQLEAIPRLVTDAQGKAHLMLKVNSPFASSTALRNDFGYTNTITAATATVRTTVLDLLREGLGEFVNKEFELPLDAFLSQKGLEIAPKSIRLIDSSYLMIAADLSRLDLRALNGDAGSSDRSCK